jgi:hypothetical protein
MPNKETEDLEKVKENIHKEGLDEQLAWTDNDDEDGYAHIVKPEVGGDEVSNPSPS